jgi:hypothetical protein
LNRDGYLPNDQRHSIKVFGAKDWVLAAQHRLSTGVAIRAHSGTPTTPTGADPDYGPGFGFLQQRGTGPRLPWDYSADVQLGYRFNINKQNALTFTVDVFNFLNIQNITETEQNYTTESVTVKKGGTIADAVYAPDTANAGKPVQKDVANYGNATGYSAPRIFRFGARWTF